MAFELKNSKKLVSDINVTPLVDVMLVLLIIFMITAPMMLNGIALNLPKTKEVNRMNLTSEQVVLSVTRAGEYYIGKDKFLYSELVPEITARFKKNNTTTVYLRADFDLRYGKVAVLMSKLKHAGITNIALVTEIEDN